jgi:uncharacterized membrane protein YhaH (DUF805 family)
MVGASTSYFLRFYFSVQGRTGRKAYWLFYILPAVLTGVMFGFLISTVHIPTRSALVLLIALAPLLVWVGLADSVKRLHDIDRSAWWTVLCFVPYLNYVAVPVLGIIPGKTGSNSYAENPHPTKPPALQ